MLIDLLLVLLGLGTLTLGGEAVVRGALVGAQRLGISPIVAGLVIVGFGTSAPELVVSVDAAIHQRPDIAVGNVVGSNIANILLILAVCALIRPLSISRAALRRDGFTLVGATVLFLVLAWGAGLGRADGVLLIASLAAYLAWTFWRETRGDDAPAAMHRAEADEMQVLPHRDAWIVASLIGGLVLLAIGSRLTVEGALGLGAALGVSEAVIGLTVVAVGTSLPEFAVSVLATLRRHNDVAVGNILGSNIFNLLGILGISALLQPLPVHGRMLLIDQWVMLAAALALLLFLISGRRLSRIEGGVLLAGYVIYVVLMYTPSPA